MAKFTIDPLSLFNRKVDFSALVDGISETLLVEAVEDSGPAEPLGMKSKIPSAITQDVSGTVFFSETETDKGGSIFYTKFAAIPELTQFSINGGSYPIRQITNASATMTILKDKDSDWQDWGGTGQLTIGFEYNMFQFGNESNSTSVDMYLTVGHSPYMEVHAGALSGVHKNKKFSIIRRASVTSIQFLEATGFQLIMRGGRAHINA